MRLPPGLENGYITAVADVTTAAAQFLDRHHELAAVVRAPAVSPRSPEDTMRAYQESLDLLVRVAKQYDLMATMRANLERFARPVDRQHPEDAGPIHG